MNGVGCIFHVRLPMYALNSPQFTLSHFYTFDVNVTEDQ